MPVRQKQRHRIGRIGWLRAAVLGVNDGILSTASLVLGVAAAHATRTNIRVAGVAGLVAGAMSMTAGEYVSVHSQADTERADLKLERRQLKADNKGEHKELAAIYVSRGLAPELAKQVAEQLMSHDALGAHARDELGISKVHKARPIQAALASAGSFALGAAMPLLVTSLAPEASLIPLVSGSSLVFLALLGGLATRAGGARATVGAIRVTFWGALAMAVTAGSREAQPVRRPVFRNPRFQRWTRHDFRGVHLSIPLKKDGKVVGAIGVSGGSGDQDHAVAEAAPSRSDRLVSTRLRQHTEL